MVEKEHRTPIESADRGNPTPQWEVFVRQEETDPMRHVGSVAAASGTEAHEHASRLFGWYAVDIWCCPADEVQRYSASGLAADTDDREEPAANEDSEPRVYEETEGKPQVRES